MYLNTLDPGKINNRLGDFMQNKVLIVLGSDSDLPVMMPAVAFLEELEVEYAIHISSAHRLPEKTAALAGGAEQNGFGVIIGAAGGAAHLPGVIAAMTPLPVIGVPIKTASVGGVDSLYSIVQMPAGIPVATVAIDGAKNAAILAAQILGVGNSALRDKLKKFKTDLAAQVEAKDQKLQAVGVHDYLK